MSKKPLYELIYEHYKDKILSGEYNPGDQLPTQDNIGKEFNVSRITVTRALKELELKNYIYKIQGSGSYVNERKINTAKHEGERVSMISVILPFRHSISSDLLRGIEKTAKKYDYFVTVHNSVNSPRRERKHINKIISSGSQGIILYPLETKENIALYSNLIIDKYPLVLVDKSIPGLDLPLVSTNNREAFAKIINHLLDLGHTKIIFIGTDIYEISSQHERYKGFCDAHIQYGIPLLDKHIYSIKFLDEIPPNYKPNESLDHRAFNYLFDTLEDLKPVEKPTAIAAVNDQMASFVITVAQERGIKIPEQYSLTGFDNLPFSSMLQVPLTTYAQPIYKIGKVAASELFDIIETPDKKPLTRTIKGKLITRKSTKSIKK